jgi:transposase
VIDSIVKLQWLTLVCYISCFWIPTIKSGIPDAIHEAMLRPGLRFVAVRSIDNQALLMAHKVREMLVQQRSQLLNGLRGHLAEIGVIAAQGTCNMRALGSLIREGHSDIPEVVRPRLMPLVRQITHLEEAIKAIDSDIAVQAKADPVSTAR